MLPIVDTALSMVFIFLLFSIIVSAIIEIVQHWRRSRAYILMNGIKNVLCDPLNKDFANILYAHPLIDSLKQNKQSVPDYIQSKVFADALVSVISSQPLLATFKLIPGTQSYNVSLPQIALRKPGDVLEDYKKAVDDLQHSDLKILLSNFCLNAGSIADVQNSIAVWYDEYMKVVTSWYKRKIIRWSQITGFVVAVLFNVNSIQLAKELYVNKILRDRVVVSAIEYQKQHANDSTLFATDPLQPQHSLQEDVNTIKNTYHQAASLQLPIGWDFFSVDQEEQITWQGFVEFSRDAGNEIWKACRHPFNWLGWLITGFAIAYGSDYWFNILSKFINIRSTLKPQEKESKS